MSHNCKIRVLLLKVQTLYYQIIIKHELPVVYLRTFPCTLLFY